jgi:alcohol dehydrogenase YqhD (iron-dependent ADH family)
MEAFFESLGVPTRLMKYDGIAGDTPSKVAAILEQRGFTKLGERQDLTPKGVSQVLSMSLAA